MTDVNETAVNESEESEAPKKSDTETLIELARDHFRLFHDDQDRGFARGATTTMAIASKPFRMKLQVLFRKACDRYPNPNVVKDACSHLAAEAVHEWPEEQIWLRVGGTVEHFELHLGGDDGLVVRIKDGGWSVAQNGSMNFPIHGQALMLPQPVGGGDLDLLRPFVNVASDDDFMLVVAWLVMTLNPMGPYPVAAFQGEQGSAKSTTTRVVKALVDPTAAPLRALPNNPRDLAITAETNRIVALDNLSGLRQAMSDPLCRLSTGGGFGTRRLFSDSDEQIFDQCRPVILNGIDAVATSQDLLDRAIVLRLPKLEVYREESAFWEEFEQVRPAILGALLDVAAYAAAHLAEVQVDGHHRMADFVKWILAAAPALGWDSSEFLAVYSANHDGSLSMSLDGNPVARTLAELVAVFDGYWAGTATELHSELAARRQNAELRSRAWPANAQSLSRSLTRLAPGLRLRGIEIEHGSHGRDRAKERWISVTSTDSVGTQGTTAPEEAA